MITTQNKYHCKEEFVLICVCTRGRPKMLAECIRSLSKLQSVDQWHTEIVIINNNEQIIPDIEIEALTGDNPYPMHIVHEKNPGIPFARNKALETCLELKADWIAFIDDDEKVESNWLQVMYSASQNYDAEVFHGWGQSFPDSKAVNLWGVKAPRNKRLSGSPLLEAATDNVIFRSEIIKGPNPLRFDENMRYSGGSDREFFLRATQRGATIIWIPEAIAKETIPKERLTFKYLVSRSMSVGANQTYIDLKHSGLLTTVLSKVTKAIGRFFGGIVLLILSPLLLLFGIKRFRKHILESSKKVSYALGVLRGLTRKIPNRYLDIQGR